VVGNSNPYQNDLDDEWIRQMLDNSANQIDIKLWFNDWSEAMQSSSAPLIIIDSVYGSQENVMVKKHDHQLEHHIAAQKLIEGASSAFKRLTALSPVKLDAVVQYTNPFRNPIVQDPTLEYGVVVQILPEQLIPYGNVFVTASIEQRAVIMSLADNHRPILMSNLPNAKVVDHLSVEWVAVVNEELHKGASSDEQ
jgi:hypothetical protein